MRFKHNKYLISYTESESEGTEMYELRFGDESFYLNQDELDTLFEELLDSNQEELSE